jgi:hypothetical protein
MQILVFYLLSVISQNFIKWLLHRFWLQSQWHNYLFLWFPESVQHFPLHPIISKTLYTKNSVTYQAVRVHILINSVRLEPKSSEWKCENPVIAIQIHPKDYVVNLHGRQPRKICNHDKNKFTTCRLVKFSPYIVFLPGFQKGREIKAS